MQLDTANQGS
jgi:hypothetical protein